MSNDFIVRRGLKVSQGITATTITASGMQVDQFNGTASFAVTASNIKPLNQDVEITGSTRILGNLEVIGTASFTAVTASNVFLNSNTITTYALSPSVKNTGLVAVDSASMSNSASLLYNTDLEAWTFSKKLVVSGSVNISGSFLINGQELPKGGASVTISGSVPSGSRDSGSLWWNSNDGNLYIQVTSPTGSTYVAATNTVAGGNYGSTLVSPNTGSTWNINHNFNTLTPLITVYSGSNVMIPADILSIDANNTRITFSGSVTGTAILSTGIGNATTNLATTASIATSASFARSASFAQSASFATTASVANTITSTSGSGLWVWNQGNPTGFGWTLSGNASYSNAPANGIILTTDTTNQSGLAFRTLSAAYFANNDFVMTINAKSSGSTGTTSGGDGIALYVGALNNGAGAYDGITVYLDEYNAAIPSTDVLKINVNNSQIAVVDLVSFTGFLDTNRWRKLTAVVTGTSPSRTLTVLLDDIIVWRSAITWTPTGGNYGVWGFTGGARNHHAVNMINLQPAKMWMMSNGLL